MRKTFLVTLTLLLLAVAAVAAPVQYVLPTPGVV